MHSFKVSKHKTDIYAYSVRAVECSNNDIFKFYGFDSFIDLQQSVVQLKGQNSTDFIFAVHKSFDEQLRPTSD